MTVQSHHAVNTVFATYAPLLRDHGSAPIPLNGKTPLVSGFHKWRGPPSQTAVAKLAAQFPDADVGYVAGPSGLVAFDADDAEAAVKGRETFGDTPVSVRTRRGVHMLYKQPRHWTPRNVNLRTILGINADLKAGAGILVAPASRFADGSGHYEWLGDGLDGLRRLPEFPIERLRLAKPMRADGQWLNDRLCAEVGDCNDFDALLDVARTLNAGLAAEDCVVPDDAEVIRIARNVWRDYEAGKIKRWDKNRDDAALDASAIAALCRIDPKGTGDAFVLFKTLWHTHARRCYIGATFGITPKAMAKGQTIPGWPRARYERAAGRSGRQEGVFWTPGALPA